jgi:DNA-directed RNA polymerase subunit RPC12/RpoP
MTEIQLIKEQHTFPVLLGYCINWIHMKNTKTFALQCPTCHKAFCLADHTIDENGIVLPSVVCPFNCGFHVMMKINF